MYLEIIDWLLVNTVNMKKKTYCFAAQPEEILFHRAPKSRGIFPQNSLNFFFLVGFLGAMCMWAWVWVILNIFLHEIHKKLHDTQRESHYFLNQNFSTYLNFKYVYWIWKSFRFSYILPMCMFWQGIYCCRNLLNFNHEERNRWLPKDEKSKGIIAVSSLSGACFWWKINLHLKFPSSTHKVYGRRITEKTVPSFGCMLISQWCNGRLWLKSLSFQAPINTADSANSNILTSTDAGPSPYIKYIYGLYIHTIKNVPN